MLCLFFLLALLLFCGSNCDPLPFLVESWQPSPFLNIKYCCSDQSGTGSRSLRCVFVVGHSAYHQMQLSGNHYHSDFASFLSLFWIKYVEWLLLLYSYFNCSWLWRLIFAPLPNFVFLMFFFVCFIISYHRSLLFASVSSPVSSLVCLALY